MADLCRTGILSGYGIWEICRCLFLFGGLGWIAWTDLREQKISNRFLLHLLWIRSLFLIPESRANGEWAVALESAYGFLIGGGLCFCCHVLSRGGIGAGDVKLFAVAGFYLGRTGVLRMAIISVFLAAGLCVVLLAARKADRYMRLPYAPFAFLAAVVAVLGGTG